MTDTPARLAALSQLAAELGQKLELDARINRVLGCLTEKLALAHCMLLVPSDVANQLVMLACAGYSGGVGATVRFGQGAIGVCAERRRPLRLNNVQRDLELLRATGESPPDATEIPLPGLPNVRSQLAIPALLEGELVGVLYAEDQQLGRFTAEDSEVLQLAASLLAPALFHPDDEADAAPEPAALPIPPSTNPLRVRYYEADSSVFFDDDYVIKSLPGRLLFTLLEQVQKEGRRHFTKKELRVNQQLGLPAVRDNLDTRLILLRRRLAERFPFVQIVLGARGCFSLRVERPFALETIAAR
jgi:adenylate cyclase